MIKFLSIFSGVHVHDNIFNIFPHQDAVPVFTMSPFLHRAWVPLKTHGIRNYLKLIVLSHILMGL